MNELLTLTFEELDSIADALLIMKRNYPLSWSDKDEKAFRKIINAWNEKYEIERSNHGEEESWPEESPTTEGTI